MFLLKHELKQGWKAMLLWSFAVGIMIVFCLMLFPELKTQMAPIQAMMQGLGGLAAAFGMDRLNYGELIGFYGIYAGFMLGIGGMFYAAILGCGMLSKEEAQHTAETLLTYPVGRGSICIWKLGAAAALLLCFNVLVVLFSLTAFAIIGEFPQWKPFALYHLAQLTMQLEIAGICFGISAFLRKGSGTIGMAIAFVLYFLGIAGNITEKAGFVRYITPYAYADGASIISKGALDGGLVALGIVYMVVGIIAGFWKYKKKDIL